MTEDEEMFAYNYFMSEEEYVEYSKELEEFIDNNNN